MADRGSWFGTVFAWAGPRMDRRGADAHRRELVSRLSGAVLEIGAGYGATFPFYPPSAAVTALEPDAGLRARARRAATVAAAPIHVAAGRAESVDMADGSVDAVVSSLVLCSVDDQAAVLAEMWRILRPGGVFAFYEHVRSDAQLIGLLEDAATPAWGVIAGGCHPNRDTVSAIKAAGFGVQTLRRFGFSVLPSVPNVAHVIGRAEKPG